MRVIAGISRGIKLKTLQGTQITRPTIDRVKEGIFSSVHFILEGANVLDLFSGSGQMGIEALSRGAKHCFFVDDNSMAIDIIKQNLAAANLIDNATIIHDDVHKFLNSTSEKFNCVFLDPPFHNNLVDDTLPILNKVLQKNAVIMAESETNANLQIQYGNILLKKRFKYGSVTISKYINTI